MALQDIVNRTVTGLGFEPVEIERAAGGLLRITIDWPYLAGAERFITVEDCEKVTRQLQYVLDVEEVEYRRLEVSSPGIDRLLRGEADFERFTGALVDIVLKQPIGATQGASVAVNRKKFRGTLERPDDGGAGWQLVWREQAPVKPGQRVSRKRPPAPLQALRFSIDELREARLASVVDFKGRRDASNDPVAADPGGPEAAPAALPSQPETK